MDKILDFWFGTPSSNDYGMFRPIWFEVNPELDREISDRFLTDHQAAANGNLDTWKTTPLGCLALILLLDQIPRNIYRGTPQAFATDSQALNLTKYALANGFDTQLLPIQRWFIYLPLEHSENLGDQRQCVYLFAKLPLSSEKQMGVDFARKHCQIIEKFGRFPHRNQILGRETTPEEAEFLMQPDSSFG
ncbi:DUF924 family protein [Merismopedia glauca]|uniref:DUF924 domain-containing protein n=1 Tax=Merismopedia glauca CCAP 1448/3 TaxID=1296344 RepID=A0A2T1C893_9CYAN|nr:DUF924 family protein [Merismopedia glauca]PSB04461.1 DUF924 domain-containing protein [Merismopedia glauca CCAP 1448/3]